MFQKELGHEQARMHEFSELAPCPRPMSLVDMLVLCAGKMQAKSARRAREDQQQALTNQRFLEDQIENNLQVASMQYRLLSTTKRF